MTILEQICLNIVDCEHKTAPTQANGIPSIRTTDIKRGVINFRDANKVSEETYEAWTQRLEPQPQDLILAREAPVGEVGIIPNGQKACLGQRTVLIRPNPDKVYPYYLLYLMLSSGVQHEMKTRAAGSTVEHLNMSDIRELELPDLPTLEIQRQVGDTLANLDRKIENLRKQNETLEAIAQSLFKHWFVDFEFPNEDGKPYKSSGGEMKRSGIGEIPAGWKIGKLGDITKVINGRAYKQTEFREEGTPIVRIQNLTGKGQTVYSDLMLDEDKYISKGDLIYAWSATFGPYIWRGVKSIYHYHIWKLNCFSKKFKYYLYIHLKRVSDRVKNQGTGSIFTHITKELMESQELFVPGEQVMCRWHDIASPIFDKVMLNYEQIETLTKTRDALLPQLMSGKISIEN